MDGYKQKDLHVLFQPDGDHHHHRRAIEAPPQLSGPQLYETCPEPHQWIPRGAGNGASLRAAFAFVGRRTRRAQDAAARLAPNRPHGPRVSPTCTVVLGSLPSGHLGLIASYLHFFLVSRDHLCDAGKTWNVHEKSL